MDKYDKLFHIRKDRQGRIIPLIPVLDDQGKWHMWLPHEDDLLEIPIVEPVRLDYFAKRPASGNDVYFRFVNFIHQRCLLKSIHYLDSAIREDMHNLAACLAKIEYYFKLRDDKTVDVSRFVATEIEYLFYVCRSLYDLLQKVAKEQWQGTELIDKSILKKPLEDSFAVMALKGPRQQEIVRSAQELHTKYGLTPRWSQYYPREAPFFKKLRRFRNDIDHKGLSPGDIFVTPKGFAVRSDYEPFATFGIWKEKTFLAGDLTPIKPVLAHVIQETIGALERFVDVLSGEIKFPEDIAPGYFVFLRGPHIEKLARLDGYIKDDVWYGAKSEDVQKERLDPEEKALLRKQLREGYIVRASLHRQLTSEFFEADEDAYGG